ncbi:hypothetical protein BJH93_04150 [Kocuria polaris]|nr:hypothetical protein [Kocuria polaris]
MTTESQNTAPDAFDLDAWMHDAKLAERSAIIYQRPDVFGELTELQREIEDLEAALKLAADEPTQSESRALSAARDRYSELLDAFTASQLTVYLRALPDATIRDMRIAHDARWQKSVEKDPKLRQAANTEFGYELLAASIFAVKPAGGEQVLAAFDLESIKRLDAAIGGAQTKALVEERQKVQLEAPEVTADFLRGASGISRADTSD